MVKMTSLNAIMVLVLLGVVAAGYYFWNRGGREETDYCPLEGFTRVDDYPLYTAEYVGDYRFPEYLRTGVRPSLSAVGCTCFTVGGSIFGRNFDFPENPALLLCTSPEDGYRSVSMVDLGYFGYSLGNPPTGEPTGLEGTPYLPFDGMNERGLVVGMAAIPYADPPESPGKVTIGEIAVIRLLLDYASDVGEALELLGAYNVEMTTPPIHYLIADTSGESVIVEFLEGEMKLYRSNGSQVMTNFLVTVVDLPGESPCQRYDSVHSGIADGGGAMSVEHAFSLLEASSQSSTIWSAVYDMKGLTVYIAMGGDYSEIHTFELLRSES